jgi:uracil-DNA glycosylase family 4
MDLNTAFSDYWELLNNYEDHIKGGYRSDHNPPPPFEFAPSLSHVTQESPLPVETEPLKGSPRERIISCRDCDLHLARKGAIAGRGPEKPRLMIILPPPGYEEDDNSVPISGEREDFLNKWIGALGLGVEEVFLTNTVKCRTPGTRPPLYRELLSCRNRLFEQIDSLKPSALLILGETALSSFTDFFSEEASENFTLTNYHGRPFSVKESFSLATYAPEDVLAHRELKRPVWEDLKILRDFLNHG